MRHRARSAGHRSPKDKKTLKPENIKEIGRSYLEEDLGNLKIAALVAGTWGPAIPSKATGDIGHPFNMTSAWRWLELINKLLNKHSFGLWYPLQGRIRCVRGA